MLTFETLDDSHSGNEYQRPSKPIWAMDLTDRDNDKNLLKWLKGEIAYLQDESEDRLRDIEKNLALYQGIQYTDQDGNPNVRDRHDSRFRNVKKIVVNHLFDLTENKVSRLIKYKPAVAVLPTNDEHGDKVAAKATDKLLKHIWYQENFEGEVAPDVARDTHITGESYLWIDWDPDKGDLHPDWVKAQKDPEKFPRIPLMDENGVPEKDELGNIVYIDRPVRVGDVCYEIVLSPHVFVERETSFKKSNYIFRKHIWSVEKARAMFPDSASKIKSSKDYDHFDFETLERRQLNNEVVVWEFWHKKTREMSEGRKVFFTDDAILSSEEHPFSHGDFPCVRYSDIDYPGQVHSKSFFTTVKHLTGTYNNITNLIIRNQFLVAHPKWMVPKGSVKIDSLGNDITVVQYRGPQPPQLVQMNPTPSELFAFRGNLKEEFQQISGIFGVSRGEPPQGIKAGVALQFLAEQESERSNRAVLKWNEFIRQVALKTLAVAGDYYDSSDERMIRVLGSENEWMTEFFDASHLSKPYDVRVQNSSALPQSKAARTQTLLDLKESFPDAFPQEQVLDMLELSQSEKFMDRATVAVKSAEAEDQAILDSKYKGEPEEYEDHYLHWKIHVKTLQTWAFKNRTPRKIQEKLIDHVRGHEMLMMEQAKRSPQYQEKLATLDMFPIFYQAQSEAPVEELPAPEQPQGGALTEGPLPGEEGLPINAQDGLPVNEVPPSVELQAQGQAAAPPEPGPIEPTGAV